MVVEPAAAEPHAKVAANTCRNVLRYDKRLTKLKNRTVCYQAAVQGDRYARKMLHRSSFLPDRALSLYLGAAIPAATPHLERDPRQTKSLQRQQAAFWRKTKDADLDLLFLQDNASLPYRFAKITQKGKVAEVVVHFQRGLKTNIESTPTRAASAARYVLTKPVKTWFIVDFEPIRLPAANPQDWINDYLLYARSAYGNDVHLVSALLPLAEQIHLPHFWLDGNVGSDADFLSRNHGKTFLTRNKKPFITATGKMDSRAGTGTADEVLEIGFLRKDPNAEDDSLIIDPRERGQYRIVERGGQWFIAAFEELMPEEGHTSSGADDDRLVFNNPASVAEYLLQSRTWIENLQACKPSETTFSIPTVPAKTNRYVIEGYEGDLCRFNVTVIGAIGMLCKVSAETIEALIAQRRHTAQQLEELRHGTYPFRVTGDEELKARISKAMSQACKVTMNEQPPINMEKYVEDTFAYLKNLKSCTPSTYSYQHPMVPGFTAKNVIKGYKGDKCIIHFYIPGDRIVKCKASSRYVEVARIQISQMLKDLKESGRYEFSMKIDLGSGTVSSSELGDLMSEECQW
ncbi:MAG: hypothetical protein QGI51_07055 [Dehalococcoidales bacterium]|nr:hypothetical protein [Dehalococcoidales bacterium]